MRGGLNVTFVLPGRGRSGGVRVTAEMAGRLLELGYSVRIAYRIKPKFTAQWFKDGLRNYVHQKMSGPDNTDWLYRFRGELVPFSNLSGVRFSPGEVVVAVGTHTVKEVYELKENVVKVRYNHGFSLESPAATSFAWGIPMLTIAVSNTLVPRLEGLSGGSVSAVVPNGIDQGEYFIEEKVVRNGVGFMYSSHPVKCPRDMVSFARNFGEMMPHIPQYYFGGDPGPKGLDRGRYVRYPSVAEARGIYNKALVWISTSRAEGFGLPLLEAMACGCAVVSADNLGAREIIRDGENGFLAPVGDIDAFIEIVRRLIEEPALRATVVGSARDTVKKFTWENAAEKMDAFLKQVSRGTRPE